MRKVKEPLPEAPCKVRRTHFTSSTKNSLLVKSVRNRDFCVKVLEIGVKVLNLELDIAEKFPDQYYTLPGDSSSSEESSDEEEQSSGQAALAKVRQAREMMAAKKAQEEADNNPGTSGQVNNGGEAEMPQQQ